MVVDVSDMTWVKLNVGGQRFETSLSTISKYPESLLAKMIADNTEKQNHGDDEAINIDCDQEYFSIILTWLR